MGGELAGSPQIQNPGIFKGLATDVSRLSSVMKTIYMFNMLNNRIK